jgi:hypothetical protein
MRAATTAALPKRLGRPFAVPCVPRSPAARAVTSTAATRTCSLVEGTFDVLNVVIVDTIHGHVVGEDRDYFLFLKGAGAL